MAPNRDYLTSAAAMTSTHTVVAAGGHRPCAEVVGEDARAQGQVAAMLRLTTIFPVTVATDMALAGYDVLGWVDLTSGGGVPAVCIAAKAAHDARPHLSGLGRPALPPLHSGDVA